MATALVTGGLDFIGHHVAHRLIADGWRVKIIDRVSDNGDASTKVRRAEVLNSFGADVIVDDIQAIAGSTLLHEVDVVFHLTAQAGVPDSWGSSFAIYTHDNIVATKHLLECALKVGTPRVVCASSSSVYGDPITYPTPESALLAPTSPYGITKLAGEHLMRAYSRGAGLETACLRYFNVYGPGQRPGAAFFRIIDAALNGSPFIVNGSGNQARDFAYIDDVVRATILAGTIPLTDHITCNIAGGTPTSVLEAIEIVQNLSGMPVRTEHRAAQMGDPYRSEADMSAAKRILGWEPEVPIVEGLRRQLASHVRVESTGLSTAMSAQ